MSKIFFIMLTVSFDVVSVAAISLTIIPDHLHVTDAPQSVTYTCTADVALIGCHFRWWLRRNNPGPLLDLSGGSQSQADPAHLVTDSVTGYSYSGRGLGAGDCGVSLQVEGYKNWMVACRVRAEGGGWTYAWSDLFADSYNSTLPLNLTTPREVVVLPGGEARFSLEAGEPLKRCNFNPWRKQGGLDFSLGPNSYRSTAQHLYIGAGLQSGQCGLALTNVSKTEHGPFRCSMETQTSKFDTRFLMLVVASPPTKATLSLAYSGTNVTATCEAWSCPVAKISWLLGDNIIRQDENDDSHISLQYGWIWPWWKRSILQTLTLQLQPQHNGKDLKCRVSHIALAQPLEANSTLSIAG